MVGGQEMRRWTSVAPAARHHADDLARGRAADDGVVDEDDALAFEQGADGVELHADAEVADALLGLDEGAADVVVADEAEVEGDAGLGGVAEGGGDAGVGDGDDEVGGDAGLAGELAAHLFAGLSGPSGRRCGSRGGRSRRARRCRRRCGVPRSKMRLVTPSSETMTSSPGSTSRSYLAWRRSKAQVSEAKTKVSGAPSSPAMRPMESGRKPWGSRAAKMRLRVIMTMEKAPSTWASESAMQSTRVLSRASAR